MVTSTCLGRRTRMVRSEVEGLICKRKVKSVCFVLRAKGGEVEGVMG